MPKQMVHISRGDFSSSSHLTTHTGDNKIMHILRVNFHNHKHRKQDTVEVFKFCLDTERGRLSVYFESSEDVISV